MKMQQDAARERNENKNSDNNDYYYVVSNTNACNHLRLYFF